MSQMIIDVREPSEFSESHIFGAINIPPKELIAGARELDGLDKNTEIILYCLSGSRSNSAMRILKEQGFTNLTNGINQDHVAENYHLKIVT